MEFHPGEDLIGVADGLEAVVLLRPGSSWQLAVPHALYRPVKTREAAPADGWYTTSDVSWHLPVNEVADWPRLGDVIRDRRGRRWTILAVRLLAQGTRWRCIGRDLAIVHHLDQAIRIERRETAKGADGEEEAAWRLWRAGILARIQPLETEIASIGETVRTHHRYRIYLADDLLLDHRHRIRGPDGVGYRVLACRKAQRIDALVEIDVERAEL